MNWFTQFLASSLGRKFTMSLTGLFLILFLMIHLSINFTLIFNDEGALFGELVESMESNPLIKVVSYVLYLAFILHIIQAFLLYNINRKAKGQKYQIRTRENATFASKNMTLLGSVILIFLIIHLLDFFYGLKIAHTIAEEELYSNIVDVYKKPGYVILYVVSMIFLALHLSQGFQSAFQTLGLNHQKYTPLIKFLGKLYSIVVPLGFAIIPIYVYFFK